MDVEKIKYELRKMKAGFCAVKWDCLVWRVDSAHWQVGANGISLKNDALNVEDAAELVKLLNAGS